MKILEESKENIITVIEEAKKSNMPFIIATDTIYGLAAPLSSTFANDKIYELKARSKDMPFPILVGSMEQMGEIADLSALNIEQRKFMDAMILFSTFILKANSKLDAYFNHNGTVAVRLAGKEVLAKALIEAGPITATSVNRNGEPFMNEAEKIVEHFHMLDYLIKGETPHNASSSIYDLSGKGVVQAR